jgi:hypothetical protein
LEQQIGVLSAQLEAAAPADVPAGVGKLTTVIMTREICLWERFTNRRAIGSYTGLCVPVSAPAAASGCRAA